MLAARRGSLQSKSFGLLFPREILISCWGFRISQGAAVHWISGENVAGSERIGLGVDVEMGMHVAEFLWKILHVGERGSADGLAEHPRTVSSTYLWALCGVRHVCRAWKPENAFCGKEKIRRLEQSSLGKIPIDFINWRRNEFGGAAPWRWPEGSKSSGGERWPLKRWERKWGHQRDWGMPAWSILGNRTLRSPSITTRHFISPLPNGLHSLAADIHRLLWWWLLISSRTV